MKDKRFTSVWLQAGALLLAIAGVGAFYAAALRIPSFTDYYFSQVLSRDMVTRNIPHYLARGERLDEVRQYLDARLREYDATPLEYAWRGRLEAMQHGPEAGFFNLLDLLEIHSPGEMTEQWLELASLAGEAGRWDDFFNLCAFLMDYGEDQRVLRIFQELRSKGLPLQQALFSPEGLRFLAFSGLGEQLSLSFRANQAREQALYALWRAERQLRLDGKMQDENGSALIRCLLPDPRARLILARAAGAVADEFPSSIFQMEPLLVQEDFTVGGEPAEGEWLRGFLSFKADLPSPARGGLWMMCSAQSVLQVYPLIALGIDGEVSIHYLPYTEPFLVHIEQQEGRAVHAVEIRLLNAFKSLSLEQERGIRIWGIWPEE